MGFDAALNACCWPGVKGFPLSRGAIFRTLSAMPAKRKKTPKKRSAPEAAPAPKAKPQLLPDVPPPSPERPIKQGDLSQLFTELKRMAHGILAGEGNQGVVHTTELALSALRRIKFKGTDWSQVTWNHRGHFFGAARQAMRRALIDHARSRIRRPDRNHAGNLASEVLVPLIQQGALRLSDLVVEVAESEEATDAVVAALDELKVAHPEIAEVIEQVFWLGLTQAEIARNLEITDRTVRHRLGIGKGLLLDSLFQKLPDLQSRLKRPSP